LAGILALPGFWSDMGIVHSGVANRLCSEMVTVLEDIGADILKLGPIDESDPQLDYDGVDFLATTILDGLLDWFHRIDREDWTIQLWYERLRAFAQILRQQVSCYFHKFSAVMTVIFYRPRSAELLPISSVLATSVFDDILPTTYQAVEMNLMVKG
jgi:hypothetical protein